MFGWFKSEKRKLEDRLDVLYRQSSDLVRDRWDMRSLKVMALLKDRQEEVGRLDKCITNSGVKLAPVREQTLSIGIPVLYRAIDSSSLDISIMIIS